MMTGIYILLLSLLDNSKLSELDISVNCWKTPTTPLC